MRPIADPPRRCAALLLAAPASGQGKTSATAALARRALRQGQRVRVFKVGADFLDPLLLRQASGSEVYNLDPFQGSMQECRRLLYEAAADCDLILVEGMMGLFDGQPSAADLAVALGLPVLALIDASAMAQTFGAVAHGLRTWREELPWCGVLANRVAGSGHAEWLRRGLPAAAHWAGWLDDCAQASWPERHLGLVQPEHIGDAQARLDAAACALHLDPAWQPPQVEFAPVPHEPPPPLLRGLCVAVARDPAFCFVYPANLDCLRGMGAQLLPFSPLRDAALPPCDALWLPGGYPELHLPQLAANVSMLQSVREHAAARPLLAECGGMLYLASRLAAADGTPAELAGVLAGEAVLQPGLQALGPQQWRLAGQTLRGHTFHHSTLQLQAAPTTHASSPLGAPGEPIWRSRRVTASYVHWYFPSAPRAVAELLGA